MQLDGQISVESGCDRIIERMRVTDRAVSIARVSPRFHGVVDGTLVTKGKDRMTKYVIYAASRW